MAKIDLRTERQRQTEKRHSEICEMFKRLKNSQPLASDNRVMTAIAEKYNMTVMGVRYVLQKQSAKQL